MDWQVLTTLVYSALSVGVSAGCQHWAYGGDISTMSGDIRQLRGDFSEIRRSTALLLETVTRMETNLDAKSRTMSTLIESLQAQRYRESLSEAFRRTRLRTRAPGSNCP